MREDALEGGHEVPRRHRGVALARYIDHGVVGVGRLVEEIDDLLPRSLGCNSIGIFMRSPNLSRFEVCLNM